MDCPHSDKHNYQCSHCKSKFCPSCADGEHYGLGLVDKGDGKCYPPDGASVSKIDWRRGDDGSYDLTGLR